MLKITSFQINHSEDFDFLNEVREFDWILESDRRGEAQAGYQLIISDDNENVIWDSGKVISDSSRGIRYAGVPLKALKKYFCILTVWAKSSDRTERRADFLMGRADLPWETCWFEPRQKATIPDAFCNEDYLCVNQNSKRDYREFQPAQMIRRSFRVDKDIWQAYLFITAHGLYEAAINGKKIGDKVLTPESSPYDKRIMYQSYDITEHVLPGENVLGVILADGWWIGRIGLMGQNCQYGTKLGCLFELRIIYKNGSSQIVGGEQSRSRESAIRHADLFVGEEYSANEEVTGWDRPGFIDDGWQVVERTKENLTVLQGQEGPAVTVLERRKPLRLIHIKKGEFILDTGQVLSGWLEFTLDAPAGIRIELQHSETLDQNGCFMHGIMGKDKDQKDIYVTRAGKQTWHPRFTYHGFRYVRIQGWPGAADITQFTVCVIGTLLKQTGFFACSDERINQLYRNILWSQKGNMIAIPTDCPQREKAGWTGDIMVYAPALFCHSDAEAFIRRWLSYCRLEQLETGVVPFVVPFYQQYREFAKARGSATSAGWGDAIIHIPWYLYQATGNIAVLQENYKAMTKWLTFVRTEAVRGVPEKYRHADKKTLERQQYLWNTGFHFGDWLIPGIMSQKGAVPMDTANATKEIVASAYYAFDVAAMEEIAKVLGLTGEAGEYNSLRMKITKAFAKEFLDEDGKIENEFQGAYVLILKFHLAPDDLKDKMLGHLCRMIEENGYCLDTGFLSVPFLLEVLAENGREDVAYKLLFQTKCPGWLYMVERGATTIWESWNCISEEGVPGTYSYNHYAYGCVASFLYRNLAGIIPKTPGYGRVQIRPGVKSGLQEVCASQMTSQGKLWVRWKYNDGKLRVDVEIPVGTTAEVYLPREMVAEDKLLRQWPESQKTAGYIVVYLVSGKYVL